MLGAALDVLPPRARLLDDKIRWSARGIMGQIKSLPVDLGVSPEARRSHVQSA